MWRKARETHCFSFVCLPLIRSWTSSRHTSWCHYQDPESHAGPGCLMGLGNKENGGISRVRSTCCYHLDSNHFAFLCLLFHFLHVMLWLAVGGGQRAISCLAPDSTTWGGKWKEMAITQRLKHSHTQTYTHPCWPVHPTLFIGQFEAGNLGPS